VQSSFYERLRDAGYAPRCILDIGASNGCWSNTLGPVFPEAEYHLFEPLADCVPKYRKGLDWTLQTNPKFQLHSLALGAGNGTQTIHISPEPHGSTTLDIPVSEYFPEVQKILVRRLDDLIEAGLVPSPQVVKLDVQGSEGLVLEGATRALAGLEVAQVECWLYPGYGPHTTMMHQVVEVMEKAGLVAVDYSDPYRDASHQLFTLDLYFLRRELCGLLQGRN